MAPIKLPDLKLPSLSLPTIPKEVKDIRDVSSALDAAVVVPDAHIQRSVAKLVADNPEASVVQLINELSAAYRKRVSLESGAVGVGAAVPGVGTVVATGLTVAQLGVFFVETTRYVLMIAHLYGIDPQDREQRKALVMSSLLGDDGAEIMSQQLGISTLAWARSNLTSMSSRGLRSANNYVLKYVAKKAAKKGTAKTLGRLVPFGIGAVIGWFSGRHLANNVIDGIKTALGAAPEEIPAHIQAAAAKLDGESHDGANGKVIDVTGEVIE